MSKSTDPNKIPVAAATVVLVRDAIDGESGIEVLLGRRNKEIFFAGGAWVFPGGRVDPEDHGENFAGEHFDENHPDFLDVCRRACVREASEEANATISANDLVFMSHWEPPMEAPRRFSTFYFMGPDPAHELTADMGEILELAWMRPVDAISRRNEREIELIPPTFITLALLERFTSAADALGHYRNNSPEFFITRFAAHEGVQCALYQGDAGYVSGDASVAGERNRLTMSDPWKYERYGLD